MAKILVFGGKLKGKSFRLPPQGRAVMGRSNSIQIPIPDANMSREHCAVTATPEGYRIEDLGSTNGTFLNGRPVKEALLKDGDRILLGDTELEFRARERFDDTETKTDIEPVKIEEHAEMLETTKPVGGAVSKLKRVRFCDICGVTVPKADLDSGSARQMAGNLLCSACVKRLEGKPVDAAASLESIFEEIRREVRGEGLC